MLLHRPQKDEIERAEARQRAAQQAEKAQLEREEAKFEAELDALEQEVDNQIPLPPETPTEKREAELVRRIEALEGKQLQPDAVPLHRDRTRERREYALKDGLRMRREERRNHEKQARQQAHEAACRRELYGLGGELDAATRALAEEEGRHSEAVAKLHAERRKLDELRAALLSPLNDDESSKQRLAAVLGGKDES